MKLHYNSEDISVTTSRKLKSVISALEVKVEEFTYKSTDDVSKISVFNALPILETPEGTIFSSNAIIRFLADSHKSELYGGANLHVKALVDQWLDFTSTEFESSARAVIAHQKGDKIDFGKLLEEVNKFLTAVEKHLAGEKKFLVGDSITIADLSLASSVSVVFSVMFGEGQRKKYPNTVAWYGSIAANKEVGPADLPKQADEAFKGGKKGAKKQETKEAKEAKQTKETKKEDDDDLFGDDDTDAAPTKKTEKKPVVIKNEKKKPTAKSIIVFDVKVYEQEQDLQKLFEKISALQIDGLVWNKVPKLVPVAFGMNKLQVGCVVEDEKVSIEDVFEKIEEWEEVQSTDTVSFNKL